MADEAYYNLIPRAIPRVYTRISVFRLVSYDFFIDQMSSSIGIVRGWWNINLFDIKPDVDVWKSKSYYTGSSILTYV